MLITILGSLIGILIFFIIDWIFNINHWNEIWESFKIKTGDRLLGGEKN